MLGYRPKPRKRVIHKCCGMRSGSFPQRFLARDNPNRILGDHILKADEASNLWVGFLPNSLKLLLQPNAPGCRYTTSSRRKSARLELYQLGLGLQHLNL